MSTPAAGKSLRRKFPRRGFKKGLGALCKGTYIIGEGVELGEGGLSFKTDMVYNEGQSLVVNFQLPHGSFVSVRAEVRNIKVDKQGPFNLVGLAFMNLKFDFKREIRTYVSARSAAEM